MTECHIQRALHRRHIGAAVVLPNYTPRYWYECDLLVVTQAGFTLEYEVKVTAQDYKADFHKHRKHYRLAGPQQPNCWVPNRFCYAMPEGMVPVADVPSYAGLVYLSGQDWRWYRVEVVRFPPALNKKRAPAALVPHMQQTAVHRFWRERFAFEQHRVQAARACRYADHGV